MNKTRFWMIFIAALLSLALTGAALAAANSQAGLSLGGESATEGEPSNSNLSISYVYTNSTPAAIPDGACMTAAINVPDSFLVADLNVGLWIAHTYRGNLVITLESPVGTSVVVLQNRDGSADNINALVDDEAPNVPDPTNHVAPPPYYTAWWQPTASLSAFDGENAAGAWTLQVCDDTVGDTGTLNTWTLFFDSGVVIESLTQTGSACIGEKVVYDFTVINGTAASQAFDLDYTSAWPSAGPAATPQLAPGASWQFTVTHTIPTVVGMGDQETLEVQVSGVGDADTSIVKTHAGVASGWEDQADLPAGRGVRYHSVVYWQGKLYKIGGFGGSPSAAAQTWLDIYDIASDTWSSGADMPAARYWQDCVAIDAKIYCAGGLLTTAVSTLYIYDIGTNLWSFGAALPAARYNYAGVALNNKYYVIGGYTTTYESSILVYDPVTNTWDNTRASMSTARSYHSIGVIGRKIYVAGGINDSALATGEVYDPALNSWSPIADLPFAWVSAADGVKHNRFLILSGGYSDLMTASTFSLIYDAVNNNWSWLPAMPRPVYGAEGDSDGTNFYVVSGRVYEGAFSYSKYNTLMLQCPESCLPVTGLDFSVNPTVPLATLPATFTASVGSGDQPILFDWGFGDGSLGSGETVDHTYLDRGTYTVWLTATNCGGFGLESISQAVDVVLPATIEVNPAGLHSIQQTNDVITQVFEICDLGDVPLDWELSETPDLLWLSEAPITGTVLSGGCSTVEVVFDSTGLTPDEYFGNLQVASNDPAEPQVPVPVILTVEALADLVKVYLPFVMKY